MTRCPLKYLLLRHAGSLLNDLSWAQGETVNSFYWRIGLWRDEATRLSVDRYFDLVVGPEGRPVLLFDISADLLEGHSDGLHLIVELVHRPTGFIASITSISLSGISGGVKGGTNTPTSVQDSIKQSVQKFSLTTKYNMIQIPSSSVWVTARVHSVSVHSPFLPEPKEPSAKRGSVSQYSKLINEESHKTKDSASADTAQWEGPAIDLSIGYYESAGPLQISEVQQLLSNDENGKARDKLNRLKFEILESVQKPLESYMHDWDLSHVTAHVDDILLSQETTALLSESDAGNTTDGLFYASRLRPHYTPRALVTITGTRSVSEVSDSSRPVPLIEKVMLGSVFNNEGFWNREVDITSALKKKYSSSVSMDQATRAQRTVMENLVPSLYQHINSPKIDNDDAVLAKPLPPPVGNIAPRAPPPPPPRPSPPPPQGQGKPPPPPLPPQARPAVPPPPPRTDSARPPPPPPARPSATASEPQVKSKMVPRKQSQHLGDDASLSYENLKLAEVHIEVTRIARVPSKGHIKEVTDAPTLTQRVLCSGVLSLSCLVGPKRNDRHGQALISGRYEVPLYTKAIPTGISSIVEPQFSELCSSDKVQVGVVIIELSVVDVTNGYLILTSKDTFNKYMDNGTMSTLLGQEARIAPVSSALYVSNVKRLKFKNIGDCFHSWVIGLLFPKLSSADASATTSINNGGIQRLNVSKMKAIITSEPKTLCQSLQSLSEVFAFNSLSIHLSDQMALYIASGSHGHILSNASQSELQNLLRILFLSVEDNFLHLMNLDVFLQEAITRLKKIRIGMLRFAIISFYSFWISLNNRNFEVISTIVPALSAYLKVLPGGTNSEVNIKVMQVPLRSLQSCTHSHFAASQGKEARCELVPLHVIIDQLKVCEERSVFWEMYQLSFTDVEALKAKINDVDDLISSADMLYHISNATIFLKCLMCPIALGSSEISFRQSISNYLLKSCPQCANGQFFVYLSISLVDCCAYLLKEIVTPVLLRLLCPSGDVNSEALDAYLSISADLTELINDTCFVPLLADNENAVGPERYNDELPGSWLEPVEADFKEKCLKRFSVVPAQPNKYINQDVEVNIKLKSDIKRNGDFNNDQEQYIDGPEAIRSVAIISHVTEELSTQLLSLSDGKDVNQELTNRDDREAFLKFEDCIANVDRIRLCLDIYESCSEPVLIAMVKCSAHHDPVRLLTPAIIANMDVWRDTVMKAMLASHYCGLLTLSYLRSYVSFLSQEEALTSSGVCWLCTQKVVNNVVILQHEFISSASVLYRKISGVTVSIIDHMKGMGSGCDEAIDNDRMTHTYLGETRVAERMLTIFSKMKLFADKASIHVVECEYIRSLCRIMCQKSILSVQANNGDIFLCSECKELCTAKPLKKDPMKADSIDTEATKNEDLTNVNNLPDALFVDSLDLSASIVSIDQDNLMDAGDIRPPPRLRGNRCRNRGGKSEVNIHDTSVQSSLIVVDQKSSIEPSATASGNTSCQVTAVSNGDSKNESIVPSLFLKEDLSAKIVSNMTKLWRSCVYHSFYLSFRTSVPAVILEWMTTPARISTKPAAKASRIFSPKASIRLTSYDKLSDMSCLMEKKCSDGVYNLLLSVSSHGEETRKRSVSERIILLKMTNKALITALQYISSRLRAVIKTVLDVKAAALLVNKMQIVGIMDKTKPIQTMTPAKLSLIDDYTTAEVFDVVKLIEAFVFASVGSISPLRAILKDLVVAESFSIDQRSHWVEVTDIICHLLSSIVPFYGYIGIHSSDLLPSSEASLVPVILTRFEQFVQSLNGVLSDCSLFSGAVQLKSSNLSCHELQLISCDVNIHMLHQYFIYGPLVLLKLLSLRVAITRWVCIVNENDSKKECLSRREGSDRVRKLFCNKTFVFISRDVMSFVNLIISKFVSLENILVSTDMYKDLFTENQTDDMPNVVPPIHSCFIPITSFGSKVNQMFTAFGLFLIIRSEQLLTSFPSAGLDETIRRGAPDFIAQLKSLLTETILNEYYKSYDKSGNVSDIMSLLEPSDEAVFGTDTKYVIRMLLDGFVSIAETHVLFPESIEGVSISDYEQTVQLFSDWRHHQLRRLGCYLSCRSEYIDNSSKTINQSEVRETMSHNEATFSKSSLGARLYVFAQLAFSSVSELCQEGIYGSLFQSNNSEEAQDEVRHGALSVTVSGLKILVLMQRSLVNNTASSDGNGGNALTGKYYDRKGPLSAQVKLYMLKRFLFLVIERALISEVRHATSSQSSVLSPYLSDYWHYSDANKGLTTCNTPVITSAMISWQEEADILHKQLRVLLHEGIYTHRDFTVVKEIIALMKLDLERQKNEVLPAYVSLHEKDVRRQRSAPPDEDFQLPFIYMIMERNAELQRFSSAIDRKLEECEASVSSSDSTHLPVVRYALRIVPRSLSQASNQKSVSSGICLGKYGCCWVAESKEEVEENEVTAPLDIATVRSPKSMLSSPTAKNRLRLFRQNSKEDKQPSLPAVIATTETQWPVNECAPLRPASPPNYPAPLTPDHPKYRKEMAFAPILRQKDTQNAFPPAANVFGVLVPEDEPVPLPPSSSPAVMSPHLGYGSRKKGIKARNNPLFQSQNSFSEEKQSRVALLGIGNGKNASKPPPPANPKPPPPPPPPIAKKPIDKAPLPVVTPEVIKKDVSILLSDTKADEAVNVSTDVVFELPRKCLQDIFAQLLSIHSEAKTYSESEQWIVWSFDSATFAKNNFTDIYERNNSNEPSLGLYKFPKSELDQLRDMINEGLYQNDDSNKIYDISPVLEKRLVDTTNKMKSVHAIKTLSNVKALPMKVSQLSTQATQSTSHINEDKNIIDPSNAKALPLACPYHWLLQLQEAFPDYEVRRCDVIGDDVRLKGKRGCIHVYPCYIADLSYNSDESEVTDNNKFVVFTTPESLLSQDHSESFFRVILKKAGNSLPVTPNSGESFINDSSATSHAGVTFCSLMRQTTISLIEMHTEALRCRHQGLRACLSNVLAQNRSNEISASLWPLTQLAHMVWEPQHRTSNVNTTIAAESERLLAVYQKERRDRKKRLLREQQEAKSAGLTVDILTNENTTAINTPIMKAADDDTGITEILKSIYLTKAIGLTSQSPDSAVSRTPVTGFGTAGDVTMVAVNSPLVLSEGATKSKSATVEQPTNHHTAELDSLIAVNEAFKTDFNLCLQEVFEKFIKTALAKNQSFHRLKSKGMRIADTSSIAAALETFTQCVEFLVAVQRIASDLPN